MKEIIDILPTRGEVCLLIRGAFDKQFCDRIIDETRKSFRPAKTHYPRSYRNNERQVKEDESLATFLFKEIKNYVPSKLKIDGISQLEQGEWELRSLNTHIRICRYLPEQYFHKHLDGVYYESIDVQSKLTFMIYLNGTEEYEGGRTLFFSSKVEDIIIGEYIPRKGDLIIFDHNLWHSGEEVSSGEKYILRSDILYSRLDVKVENQEGFCQDGHLGYIWSIVNFRDWIITGGRDKDIKIWTSEGAKLFELQGHQNSILKLLRLNSEILISCSRDQSIKIWKYRSKQFELQSSLNVHDGTVLCLCRINNQEFLSGGADGLVNRITLEGKIIGTHQAHEEWIWGIERLDEESYITIGEDGLLKIWDLSTNNQIDKWSGEVPINSVVVKDDERKEFYVGRLDGSIIKFKVTNQVIEKVAEGNCHSGIVRCLKIDQNMIISGGEDNRVKIWNSTLETLKQEIVHENFVQDILVTEDSIISVSYDGRILRTKKLQAT